MSARVVVDASVVFAWLFSEPGLFDRSDAMLMVLKTSRVLVPATWQTEVANVLVVRERQRRIGEAVVKKSLRLLEELNVEVDAGAATSALDQVLPIARRHQLTAYDAAYLELAMRERCPLATFDDALAAAAKLEGVEVFTSV
ncbi:MAG: type II toxin-antitoxin system VapC family toxin [Planctomycetota bacterium]